MTATTTAVEVETFECAGCEDLFTAVPVQDPTEIAWVGPTTARRWHSTDCMTEHAERVAEIRSRA